MENDIDADDMPIPHHIPISYVKKPLLWAFYHLKHGSTYEEAMRDIL
jgi:hypothetical protein